MSVNRPHTKGDNCSTTPLRLWTRSWQKGCVVWCTGLSGSGKSTLAGEIEKELAARGYGAFVLDGDVVRRTLNADLGFSPKDRSENIRRIAEVARLLAMAEKIVIVAVISPYRQDRENARSIAVAGSCGFIEVFVDAPLSVCEARDPKGLYRRARSGEIKDFTGIDAPYEQPTVPDIHLQTALLGIRECTLCVVDHLLARLSFEAAIARSLHEF
jgi:adenylyl-sulfate kinase